jgi:hypothetical protein
VRLLSQTGGSDSSDDDADDDKRSKAGELEECRWLASIQQVSAEKHHLR